LRVDRRRADPDIRERRNRLERERIKRVGRKRDRKKHAEQEKTRYRKKNNILTDADLKCAPKGSGTVTRHGYRQLVLKDHPNSRRDGTIFEHVVVMSTHVGRPLRKGGNSPSHEWYQER